MGNPADEPLFPATFFEYQDRPKRDGFFGIAYFVSLVAICVVGIVSFSHRNPAYKKLTSTKHINNPASCPAHAGRRLLVDGPKSDEFDLPDFLVMAGVWVLVSFVASTILGIMLLRMFQHRAGLMVKVAVIIQTAFPLVAGVALCAAGVINPLAILPGAIMLGFFAMATAACCRMWRNTLPLVARLISVATKGLDDNPAIMWIVFLLQFVQSLLSIPILFSMIVAYMNGSLVPSPSASPAASGNQCVDAKGQQAPCCVWQTESWVPAYVAFASVMLTWTTFLSFEIKVYTISGTIAQWYFAPVTATSFRGNATRSLRHAFGPSFGSLALGSGILTLCDILRNAATRNRDRTGGIVASILGCLAACLAACLASILELITKFATIRAAISGEAFFPASKNIVNLLKKNLLDTFSVWWLPAVILQTACFSLSVVMGLITGGLSYAMWEALHRPQPGLSAFLLGLITFITCLVILSFFASVLLNTIDAVFVCFAMDREHQLCTKPAVHEVYSQIPTIAAVGPIVENPDGGVSYGAPAAPPTAYDAPGYTAPGQGPNAPLVSRV